VAAAAGRGEVGTGHSDDVRERLACCRFAPPGAGAGACSRRQRATARGPPPCVPRPSREWRVAAQIHILNNFVLERKLQPFSKFGLGQLANDIRRTVGRSLQPSVGSWRQISA